MLFDIEEADVTVTKESQWCNDKTTSGDGTDAISIY